MKLIYPSKKYLQQYIDADKEYKDNNITRFSFEYKENEDVVKKYKMNRINKNLETGRVPSFTYWLVDKGEFIGQITIRFPLTEMMKKFYGNIGYSIKFSKWRKGYGTKLLSMGIEKAKGLGLDKVLICCDEDNYGSKKVIENNGGILQDIIINEIDGEIRPTCRYWIYL